MGIRASWLGLSLVAMMPIAQAAGFDCAKAATSVEKAICANSGLSDLDSALAAAYRSALAASANPVALKSGQRAWLTRVRDHCRNVDCLEQAYRGRIATLASITAGTAAFRQPASVAPAVTSVPSVASGPDVSGTWTGAARCPLGRVQLEVKVKGTRGTFRHSGFDPAAPRPESIPITIRSRSGDQGAWIYFDNGDRQEHHNGLLSGDQRMLQMGGMGDCADYTLTRITGLPGSKEPVFKTSSGGTPNGDDIIEAMMTEIMIAKNGRRIGPRRIRLAEDLGEMDVEFVPVRDVKCSTVGVAVYDCSFTPKLLMEMSPSMKQSMGNSIQQKMMQGMLDMANGAPARRLEHRFEHVNGTWRSSTFRRAGATAN